MASVLFPCAKPREQDAIIVSLSIDCLRLLNIRLRIRGDRPPTGVSSVLFVANHISWIDVLALNACSRVRFVAKAEVQSWPALAGSRYDRHELAHRSRAAIVSALRMEPDDQSGNASAAA